jgi:CheY-like chemotaxis protein
MKNQLPILVVDDQPDHAQLIQETLLDTQIPLLVQLVQSGEEAISYLDGQGRFGDREIYPYPFLVLLDLRMPGLGGFGVLRWLCEHSHLRQKTNLVVLSSVQSHREIEVVYELGAQFFWPKSDLNGLQDRFRLLHKSWLRGYETNEALESALRGSAVCAGAEN